jgi:4-carboxymuconolactone decarboxylase
MPEIPPEKMTPEQKKASDEFAAGRGTAVFGPFVPLLRSPEVMLRAKAMGDYLRYKSVLPPQLNEFAILITARCWTQGYEWAVHQPLGVKAGLKPEIAQALAEGRRPAGMSTDEEIIYEFCTELHRNQSVSDITYSRALSRFGEQGVIDLIGVNGYYTFLAMVLNWRQRLLHLPRHGLERHADSFTKGRNNAAGGVPALSALVSACHPERSASEGECAVEGPRKCGLLHAASGSSLDVLW